MVEWGAARRQGRSGRCTRAARSTPLIEPRHAGPWLDGSRRRLAPALWPPIGTRRPAVAHLPLALGCCLCRALDLLLNDELPAHQHLLLPFARKLSRVHSRRCFRHGSHHCRSAQVGPGVSCCAAAHPAAAPPAPAAAAAAAAAPAGAPTAAPAAPPDALAAPAQAATAAAAMAARGLAPGTAPPLVRAAASVARAAAAVARAGRPLPAARAAVPTSATATLPRAAAAAASAARPAARAAAAAAPARGWATWPAPRPARGKRTVGGCLTTGATQQAQRQPRSAQRNDRRRTCAAPCPWPSSSSSPCSCASFCRCRPARGHSHPNPAARDLLRARARLTAAVTRSLWSLH
jgi:hypothetical protein